MACDHEYWEADDDENEDEAADEDADEDADVGVVILLVVMVVVGNRARACTAVQRLHCSIHSWDRWILHAPDLVPDSPDDSYL